MPGKTWRISHMAARHGLSRSTLLYYDAAGILTPSARTAAGYRVYDEADDRRLRAICNYRAFGLGMEEIRSLLAAPEDAVHAALERQFERLSAQVHDLRRQQHLIVAFLQDHAARPAKIVSRAAWMAALRRLGFDDLQMQRFHAAFERLAPDAHQEFLEHLRIPPDEIAITRAAAAAFRRAAPSADLPEPEAHLREAIQSAVEMTRLKPEA